MCVCECVCISLCLHAYVYERVCMNMCVCVSVFEFVCVSVSALIINSVMLLSGRFEADITCQTEQHLRVDSMTCRWNKSAWVLVRFLYRYVMK